MYDPVMDTWQTKKPMPTSRSGFAVAVYQSKIYVIGGTVGETYTYTASTTDPDGNQIWYWFDWGDGNNSGWVGGISSGATISASYSWCIKGEYVVKVKARDKYYAESSWSDPLPISMPKVGFKSLLFQFLEQLLERFPVLSQIFLPLLNRLENLL